MIRLRLVLAGALAVAMIAVTPQPGIADDLVRGSETGGGIRGTVTDLAGAPMAGVGVEAIPIYDRSLRSTRYHGATAPDGSYEIGLPAGNWVVHFNPSYPAVEAWYGGGLIEWNATVITVGTSPVVANQALQATGGTSLAVYVVDIAAAASGDEASAREYDGRNGCVELIDSSGVVAGSRGESASHRFEPPEGTYRVRYRDCLAPTIYGTFWYNKDGGPVSRHDTVSLSGSWNSITLGVSERCAGRWPTILGTTGDDVIKGTNRSDVIASGAGNDRVLARNGADVVCLSAGDDVAYLGGGSDQAFGGTGADRIFGGAGNDSLFGQDGDDRLLGEGGRDSLHGSSGADVLIGGPANDLLDGGAGVDEVTYQSSAGRVIVNLATGIARGEGRDTLVSVRNVVGSQLGDRIIGDGLANTLNGFGGNDVVAGGAGDDVLLGAGGDDTLKGQAGNDSITGGPGTDVGNGGAGVDVCHVTVETPISC